MDTDKPNYSWIRGLGVGGMERGKLEKAEEERENVATTF